MPKSARTAACLAALISSWFGVNAIAALELHPVFRVIDVPEGLPDQNVESIIQDIYGYVWIGTRGGLVRHEGAELRLLPRNPADPNALPDNNIMSLHAHSDGMVWAGVSSHGVVEIGPDLVPRRHLAPIAHGGVLPHGNVWSMAEDCDGQLWMAFMREGFGRFDPVSETLKLYPQDEAAGLSAQGFQIQVMVDSRCRVWAIQTERIAVLDPANGDKKFRPVLERGSEHNALFYSFAEHEFHGLFIGRGTELLALEPADTAEGEATARRVASRDGLISGLAPLSDGRLLVLTSRGLGFFDPATGELERLQARPELSDSLPHDRMAGASLVDSEGGVWLAVLGNGLVYLPPDHAAFVRLGSDPEASGARALEHVSSIAGEHSDGALWMASESGAQRVDLATGRIDELSALLPDWDPATSGRSIVGLKEREYGLLVLQGLTFSFFGYEPGRSRLLIESTDSTELNFSFLRRAGPRGVWLGTAAHGLIHYDLEEERTTRYGPEYQPPFWLPESRPVTLISDGSGAQLLAGQRRIYRYHPDRGFEPVAQIQSGRIVDMAWDPGGRLWVATDFGLGRWRWQGNELAHERDYDLSALTELAAVRQVFPDGSDIWLVLSNGIARVNADSGRMRSFSRSDGMALAEFGPGASVRLKDGRLAIGGSRGLVIVDPRQLRERHAPPPVHLTRVAAADLEQALLPGPRTTVALRWRQNSVRFDFSALSYVAPERIQYRVRLDGWDDDWLLLRRQSQMYYSNLRPGRYRFEVQAALLDGDWSEPGDALLIEIAPPAWAGPWALSSYALLLLVGTGAGWQNFRRSRQRRAELREIEQKRRLAEGQRQLIERLNRDLEPEPLAHAIVGEMLRLTAAHSACIGYVHKLMPRRLIAAADAAPPSQKDWQCRLREADGISEQAIDLQADGELVARVLLTAPTHGFSPDHDQRLALLLDLAEQSLHNGVLLQRVKRLAERAEQASRAKSDFLATMSHEIRTPLHGVLGMADLLYETETNAGQQELIRTLLASGRQLQRIIDDVLDIARVEAGRMDFRQAPFELVSVLEQVLDLHAPNAARKRLDLRLRLPAELPILAYGDADRVAQVLGNLISNAIKFTERGGVELAVALDAQGSLVFTVNDSGPGIPEPERERLFQPFSQLDSSSSRIHSGSGLGLAICRQMAEAMGGGLELGRKRWPGCRFILRLPAGPLQKPPRLTRLLEGLELVALVEAPTYRVLLRLARRWGFQVRDGRRLAPRPGALVLIDGGPTDEQQAWIEGCRAGIRLESPCRNDDDGLSSRASNFLFLRWPLVESRLIGILMDLELSQRRGLCRTPSSE